METMNKEEMANVMGGGWIVLPDGRIIYIPDDEGGEDELCLANRWL